MTDPSLYPFVLVTKTPCSGLVLPAAYRVNLREAADIMALDEGGIEHALEEHGRVDTDTHILIPMEPPSS